MQGVSRSLVLNYKVAKKLKTLRLDNELTQLEVSRRLDTHPNSIAQHETGVYSHTLCIVLKYCRLYNINIDQFLKGIEVD